MVSTRTSTRSLPKKEPTFAELQAIWTEKPIVTSKDTPTTKPAAKKKRKAEDSNASTSTATKAPKPKKPRKTVAKSQKAKATATSTTPMPTTEPQVATSPGKTSFLSLPAELRNNIYAFALDHPGPIRVQTQHPYLLEPALLATNRQIRSEALGIWYGQNGENMFEIEGSSPAVKFLRAATDDRLRAIRCLRIKTFSDVAWTSKYIEDRIKQLLREFQPRGLGRQVLHFMMTTPSGLDWVNLARIKRIAKGEEDEDD